MQGLQIINVGYLETVHEAYLHNLSTPDKKKTIFKHKRLHHTKSLLSTAITFLINTQKIISKTRKQLINPFKATERT